MAPDQQIEQVKKVKLDYEQALMGRANVVGVGIGFKHEAGQQPMCWLWWSMWLKKKPLTDLSPEDVIPTELDGVPVDVQEVGKIVAL